MNMRPPAKAPPQLTAAVNARLARIESKLTALMKHAGMTTDGRNPLPEGKKK